MIPLPGTMTNFYYRFRPDTPCTLISMRKTREIGFEIMDLNMCAMQRRESELCDDEKWEKYVDEIGEEAARLGITFVQSHPPYPKALVRRKGNDDEGCEANEFFRRMQTRAIEINCRLGIRWAVLHPVAVNEYDTERNAAYNFEIYGPLLEQAAKRGVGFAFENMADLDGRRRFGAVPADLLAVLDQFGNSPDVGICWDTGHANRCLSDPIGAMRVVADRLVCTHIDDNIGQTDLHTLPYFGTICWEEIMGVLKDADYPGAFIYELAVMKRLPEHLIDPAARLAYEIGKHLVSLNSSK